MIEKKKEKKTILGVDFKWAQSTTNPTVCKYSMDYICVQCDKVAGI